MGATAAACVPWAGTGLPKVFLRGPWTFPEVDETASSRVGRRLHSRAVSTSRAAQVRQLAQTKAQIVAVVVQRPYATDDEARAIADQAYDQVIAKSARLGVRITVWTGVVALVVAGGLWFFERQTVDADVLPVTGTVASATSFESCSKHGCTTEMHYAVSYQAGGGSYTLRFDGDVDEWQVGAAIPLLVNPSDPGSSPIRVGAFHYTGAVVVAIIGGVMLVAAWIVIASNRSTRRACQKYALSCTAALRQGQGLPL